MDSLRRLEELFAHFPGIGPRQAKRFVYYILSKSPSYSRELTQLIEEVRKATSECERCHRFFMPKNGAHSGPAHICPVCADTSRDDSLLMVVARDSDFETVERSGAYKGYYFVLGGTVPILDKEPEKRIRMELLLGRIREAGSQLKEIILSLNATPEGENTADLLRDAVQPLSQAKITVLGRGLSTGAELEYVDSDTIKNALQNRH